MKKVLLIVFILVPMIIASAIFVLPDNKYSEKENRNLTVRQSVSHNFKDGSFQSDLENYLSDQFLFRDALVYTQSMIRFGLGQRDIGGAYICDGGRLIQKITETEINEKSLCAYADKINRIAENNKVYVMYVPSAGAINQKELPSGAPMYDYSSLYNKLSSRLDNAICIDLRNYLNSTDYYKTDHHWNADGAYAAYAAFCTAKGENAKKKELFKLKKVTSDFQGTLYSKALVKNTKDDILLPDIPSLEVISDGKSIDFYDYSALKTKDKYNVFQGGNHGITEIKRNADNGKTLLVFKDSFANSFIPYIVRDYSRIVIIDERYAFISAEEYVKSVKPDEVLFLREIIN